MIIFISDQKHFSTSNNKILENKDLTKINN